MNFTKRITGTVIAFLLTVMLPIYSLAEVSIHVGPFTDINDSHFRDSIIWCYDSGYLNGTAHNMFSPKETLNRGMVITALHRFAGKPQAKIEIPFHDLEK